MTFGLERFMKSIATFVLLLSLTFIAPLFAEQTPDKDSDKKPASAATAPAQGKKETKKDAKKDEKKEEPKEEKKGGMTADTFSGLKFRLIGPAVASGRVMSIAGNPKNKFEYYVGVASGG